MTKIYSYVLRVDNGAAPNPFWGLCTLTICKPVIRRNAKIGDWVIGTGSKNTRLKDGKIYNFSGSIVYAMKVTDKKTLEQYDEFCQKNLTNKIPELKTDDWRLHFGDCIYDYSKGREPIIREGVHDQGNKDRDLSGINALLSNNFYYFGSCPKPLPTKLRELIKKNQGHRKIERADLIQEFENWIEQFEMNKLYCDPQSEKEGLSCICTKEKLENDKDDNEETIC